jgi:aromatic-L-amino-acid decarboxylase
LKGPDSANEALLDQLNASGRLFLSHTKLIGKFVLRFCIGQSYTDEENVRAAWQEIQKHAAESAVAAG